MSTQTPTESPYKVTIGIEVHAELKTKSKMFCGCKNDPHAAEPNSHVCPVCMAHPGTLPVVNKEAVRKVLLVGKSLQGEIATYSEFDRKNYFYPDIPKAYQLSQYQFPFVKGGKLAGVAITRVHLEEDTARSQHTGETSAVDFNRAGVPLMELVTEPVIHDAKTAANFAKELQLLLRTIGVSDANMEKGEMRVEANISISDTDELGTKVEVKNLNSFKAVEQAIEYEIKRQEAILAKNKAILQETRGWNEQKSLTFSQRSKETAEDYRYFPDPDIPKYDISEIPEFDSRLSENLPELPQETREKFENLGLASNQVEVLLSNAGLMTFFRATLEQLDGNKDLIQAAANYLTSDVLSLMVAEPTIKLDSLYAIQFVRLIQMVKAGDINSRIAKDLLQETVLEGKDPENMAKDRGLLQDSSSETLLPIVEKILSEHSPIVEEYKSGKESVLQFLVGQGMKATKGSANPGVLAKLLKEKMSA